MEEENSKIKEKDDSKKGNIEKDFEENNNQNQQEEEEEEEEIEEEIEVEEEEEDEDNEKHEENKDQTNNKNENNHNEENIDTNIIYNIENDENDNFSFGSPKIENKVDNENEEDNSYKNNLKIDEIIKDRKKLNINSNNKNNIFDSNDSNDLNIISNENNNEDEKEKNENAPDSMARSDSHEIFEKNNSKEDLFSGDDEKILNKNNSDYINIENDINKKESNEKEEENENSQSSKVFVPSKEELIKEKEKLIEENKEKALNDTLNNKKIEVKENENLDKIENKEPNEINQEKDENENSVNIKENEESNLTNSPQIEMIQNLKTNEKGNIIEINLDNKIEKNNKNNQETNNVTSSIKLEEKEPNSNQKVKNFIENEQNSEEYKDYSNEEKENEEKEKDEEEIEEEIEEVEEIEQSSQNNEKIDKPNNSEDNIASSIQVNNKNFEENNNYDKNEKDSREGDSDEKNNSKNNTISRNNETPSRKKKGIEPHASPIFNIYGNTPMPLSSKDDVEAIIEKPREDEEREDEGFKEDKEVLKKKLINLNKNIESQKLFYTHLNPQIIDNTKKNSNYNSIRKDELIEQNTLRKDELMEQNTLRKDENQKVPDTLGKNIENNKEAEEDEEIEEVEDEEEEEDEEQSEMRENTDRQEKEKKEQIYPTIDNNSEKNISNIAKKEKINEEKFNIKSNTVDFIDELKKKIRENLANRDQNKINSVKNSNSQLNQKIIEYENKNQYTFPNAPIIKNNFTYIKKSTTGNTSFRSFNRSLKNKASMNTSLNANTQKTLSNTMERKIIGIYSKPNNYIENIEKENKEEKPKEIKVEEKNENIPNIYHYNKVEPTNQKVNNNITNLGNEYLYKYKKNKNELDESENDEYEDYEVSSENDQANNQANNNKNIVYNKKIFLMKKEKPQNINTISNNNKIAVINYPEGIDIEYNLNKKNSLNQSKRKENEEEGQEEEESEEESYEIEESDDEENNEIDDSNQGEVIEEKRQFKKKDKKKQNSEQNVYSNTIDISDEDDSKNNMKIESSESSGEKIEVGVDPENENEEIYILELEDNGLPNLKNNEILTCNINSLINLSVPKGKEISNEVSLISNCENDFPDAFFLNKIIEETKKNKEKEKNNLNQNFSPAYENAQIKKSLKPYQINPNKVNANIYFRIICKRAGNISFVLMYKDSTQNNIIKFTKPFYILVNPIINIKNNQIEINQIQMQSILSHKIGTLSNDFENYYEEASLLGYNFIHFRTLQKLTNEENIYLIKDHNELNENLFRENLRLRKNQRIQQLSNIIQNLNTKYKMGCITDVILNQASTESDWILEHSDCTYNLENTPWLNVSFELDKILVNYSNLFYHKKVKCKSAPYVNNINDIDEIIEEIGEEIDKNKLEEFFYVSLDKYFKNFKNYYQNILRNLKNNYFINKISTLIKELKKSFQNVQDIRTITNNKNALCEIILKVCNKYGYERFGVEINVEFVSLLIISLYNFENKGIRTEYYFLKEIKVYIELINNKWKEKIKELMKISLLNIKEYLRYKYLQLNNKNKIKNLIDSYFYVHNKDDLSKIFLCNGWVMNSESEEILFPDFTKYGTWYLLKRSVIVFKNSIKINYGKNIESTPDYLKLYMNKYISDLAMIFNGLYIDSIHNLPMFILKYFIDIARKKNPSIIFLCSIPEGKTEINIMKNVIKNNKESRNNNQIELLKKKYVEELGINLFIYDIIWRKDWSKLINNIFKNSSNCNNNIYDNIMAHFNNNLYSSTAIEDNQVYLGKFKYLKPKTPLNIIFNLNYENIFYMDKLKLSSLNLTVLSLIGLMDTPIGNNYELDKYSSEIIKNLKKVKKYKFNVAEIKSLMQKIKNTRYHNEETLEVFFEFHPNLKNFRNIKNIKSVKLALNYHDWRPDVELTKIKEDLFMTKIRLPIGKYYYKYVINEEIWGYDEAQPIEKDNNDNINNVIDLTNHNKIMASNLQLYIQELNNIRTSFKNKNSEIYIQKQEDLVCIIRVLADYNSLINNSIEDHDILSCKNKILFYEEKNQNKKDDSLDNDSDEEININNNNNEDSKDRIIKKEINFKFNSKSKLSRSVEKKNERNNKDKDKDVEFVDSAEELKMDNNYFSKKKNLIWGSPNYKKVSKYSSPFKDKESENNYKTLKSNSSLLEVSMDVNLGNSTNNISQNNKLQNLSSDINNSLEDNENDINKIINSEMNYYDGYAIICFPTYARKKFGKGVITIPGKLSELICGCFINEDISYIKSKNYGKNKRETYFTKNINHLKNIISSVNYYKNKTTIQFTNFPANCALIIKFKLGETIKNLINNLNKNLEMIFNKGNEFINYFDLNDINNLLFESDKDKDNRNAYEINIDIFNERKNIYDKKNNLIFRYAGLNQLVEIIKMIKRTESLNLLGNKFEELNENLQFMQSLYNDISSSDGLINYILGRLDEAKSFKLMHEFLKKLILTDYKSLPRYIKPIYFEKIIVSLHHAIMSFSLKE